MPPASQERGIRPNLATLSAGLRDASIGEYTLYDSKTGAKMPQKASLLSGYFLWLYAMDSQWNIMATVPAVRMATITCLFHVRLRYPANSRSSAFNVKYHLVFAPKPTHFSPCCLARSRARNT